MASRVLPALALALVTTAAQAAGVPAKSFSTTNPAPPKVRPTDPMRIHPAIEVPRDPDGFVWRTTSKVAGRQVTSGAIRVVAVDDYGRPTAVGTIPEGTTIELLEFRRIGATLHYAVDPALVAMERGVEAGTRLWISGRNVEPAAKK